MEELKKNYEKFRNVTYKDLMDILEEAFKKYNVDYYLIGATSRDLWIDGISSIPAVRATYDLDFAIYLNDNHEFESIKNTLVEKGFGRTQHPYRLNYGNIIIDLLPFGNIEVNRTVKLLADPPVTLSVLGFQEVYTETVLIEDNFKVASLPGLCVLKLISFNESPDRLRDIQDFEYLLDNYFEIFPNEIFDKYSDLIAEYNDGRIAGAKAIGLSIKNILNINADLKTRVIFTLKNRIKGFTAKEINEMFENNKEDIQIRKFKLIQEVINELEN